MEHWAVIILLCLLCDADWDDVMLHQDAAWESKWIRDTSGRSKSHSGWWGHEKKFLLKTPSETDDRSAAPSCTDCQRGAKRALQNCRIGDGQILFYPPNVTTFSKNIRQVLFICTFALLQKIINTKFSLPPVWKYGNSYLKIPLLDPIWGFASFFYLLPW